MEHLSERDVHGALAVVAAAAASRSGEPFALHVVDALVEVIPADDAVYVEWRLRDHEVLHAVGRPDPEEDDPALHEGADATCWSYPLRDPIHFRSTTPLKLSDFVAPRALRGLPFYAAWMRPLGLEYQIKLWLPAPDGHARCFALGRTAGRDFDERDRALLSLLRPHLSRLRSRSEERPRLPSLTNRELDVLQLVAEGLTNRQIARALFISPATVRTHLEHVYEKLGVRTRTAAVTAVFPLAS